MKKKLLTACVLTLCAVALVVGSVLTTIALLTSSSMVSNVFTIGEVGIKMYESKVNSEGKPINANGEVIAEKGGAPVEVDTNSYHLVPGETYTKDPTIRITSSEKDFMYLFVKSNNMIRSAEAGNFNDKTSETPLSMREQMHEHGWVEYVRSGDFSEIVWVYGVRNEDGEIIPTPVSRATKQIRHGAEADVAGEFRLCDSFSLHPYAQVNLYGAASVTFTGFAIQSKGFTGDDLEKHKLTQAAWEAVKGSFPYHTGIVNPVNPYNGKTGDDAYKVVAGVEKPIFTPFVPVIPETPAPSEPETSDPAEG